MSKLDQSVQFLKGAGPRRAECLARLGIETVADLLGHYPRDYVDRSRIIPVSHLELGKPATCVVDVLQVSVRPTRRGMQNFHALLKDSSGSIEAVWFNQPYLQKYVTKGAKLFISGELGRFGTLRFQNPEYELVTDQERDLLHTGRIVPIYGLTAGVSQRQMRALIKGALAEVSGEIEEVLPASVLTRRSLIERARAIEEIHFPTSGEDKDRARRRLVYEELFLYQLILIGRRNRARRLPGIPFPASGALSRRIARMLPFQLTGAQKRALVEIRDDMRRSRPMNRMLMGEVGSGKTLVALLAGCLAIEDGFQVAVLAPTEILAGQHQASMSRFLGDEPVPVRLLTGQTAAAARREFLAAAASGEAGFFVGTHALIQEAVEFEKLGLVIADEQHRFGVRQRADLRAKGRHPDVLVMSATPIPRTLAMTLCGDLDVSILDELPPGRGEVRTRVTRERNREAVYAFVRRELQRGNRCYVVYPLVSESEKSDLRAASDAVLQLRAHPAFAGFTVGLLHGQMKGEEKAAVMREFREGRCQVLVTTTVIEVGVDVPEATVMLVEHPDRYGLSQLHQLRGRIGRGRERSTFILLASEYTAPAALRRLSVLERTTSGFDVADADLELRGPGEILGTRQHGRLNLSLARIRDDRTLIEESLEDVEALLAEDPRLGDETLKPLRRELVTRYGDVVSFFDVA